MIRGRQNIALPNSIDEPVRITLDDLQAKEATHILEDMILLEEAQNQEAAFLQTGS